MSPPPPDAVGSAPASSAPASSAPASSAPASSGRASDGPGPASGGPRPASGGPRPASGGPGPAVTAPAVTAPAVAGPAVAAGGETRRALAVVVGGSRGIGLEIARSLGLDGHRVVIAGHSGERLAIARDELARSGVEAHVVEADVSSPAAAAVVSDAALELAGGSPLVLAYASGVFGPIGTIGEADIDEWRSVIEVNLLGAFYVTRLLLAAMLAAGWGRIVYVSSKAALSDAGQGAAAYAISKIGINRLAEEIAAETAGSGVTANSIHPGEVRTDMWAHIERRSAAAGRYGQSLAEWASMVERTGGDPVGLGAQMVTWLVHHPEVNGRFLLPEDWRALAGAGGDGNSPAEGASELVGTDRIV